MSSNIASHIVSYHTHLKPPPTLPAGIGVLHPQKLPEVKKIINVFYSKYYSDNHPRNFIIGINPGRFGAGVTGINFTLPGNLPKIAILITLSAGNQSFPQNLYMK